jgi:hypothetical protein
MRRIIFFAVIAAAVSAPMKAAAKPCPALIGVATNGDFYDDRGGAWVRQSPSIVEEILRGGCYPEGGPSPTSFVTLELAPGAPKARVEMIYAILARTGWPREKIDQEVWKNSPRRPR